MLISYVRLDHTLNLINYGSIPRHYVVVHPRGHQKHKNDSFLGGVEQNSILQHEKRSIVEKWTVLPCASIHQHLQ